MSKILFFGNKSITPSNFKAEDVGNKAFGLMKMSSFGIRVPFGFAIKTENCIEYFENKKNNKEGIPQSLKAEILNSIKKIEKNIGKVFGDRDGCPLLISIRSGSLVSMPGMMDTILNVGVNDSTVLSLGKAFNDYNFAFDCQRRFIEMYSATVLKIDKEHFEKIREKYSKDGEILDREEWIRLIQEYKNFVLSEGYEIPEDLNSQLFNTIEAVFDSWMNERAISYRKIYNISSKIGTAVIVQSMVFGNLNEKSGTGILFTRNPNNGEDEIYGEYLQKAQGEDVVSGTRTPLSLNYGSDSMKFLWPDIYDELTKNSKKLEQKYKNMQDIEFTVENGKLWFLQSRSGKRNSEASLRIPVDMFNEGLISKEEALRMIDEKSIENCLHKNFVDNITNELIGRGLPASSGCASGIVVFNSKEVKNLKDSGQKIIFVAKETSPEDIEGIYYADGILTLNGGMTSHAAVVTRGLGKSCICGCSDLNIDSENGLLITKDNKQIKEGEFISINGKTGEIFLGKIELRDSLVSDNFKTLISWAKEIKKIKVRVNAESIIDLKKGIEFGAEGIGLCRTEHMFFEKRRLFLLRNFLITQDNEFLDKILTLHKQDFISLFEMGTENFCFNIRFLDPPMHEFLPEKEDDIIVFSNESGIPIKRLYDIMEKMKEKNPMLGHRGCRLGITFPELYKMQSEAIFRAFVETKRKNININIELMLPLIIDQREFNFLKKDIIEIKEKIEREFDVFISCKIGTMIETPAACLSANEIAADYYSFGTNDLTQTTLGISRDDGVKFLECYMQKDIIQEDPFVTLSKPVKEIMKIAKNNILKVNLDPVMSICGEHGGDPKSIIFAIENGFSYVSCSPYRIPLAIFIAAKKNIAE